jgi:hypothetical protein
MQQCFSTVEPLAQIARFNVDYNKCNSLDIKWAANINLLAYLSIAFCRCNTRYAENVITAITGSFKQI